MQLSRVRSLLFTLYSPWHWREIVLRKGKIRFPILLIDLHLHCSSLMYFFVDIFMPIAPQCFLLYFSFIAQIRLGCKTLRGWFMPDLILNDRFQERQLMKRKKWRTRRKIFKSCSYKCPGKSSLNVRPVRPVRLVRPVRPMIPLLCYNL